jgi:hypothetical protein
VLGVSGTPDWMPENIGKKPINKIIEEHMINLNQEKLQADKITEETKNHKQSKIDNSDYIISLKKRL